MMGPSPWIYARAYDVATDFAIGITNTGDALDDAEILAACKIKNVSDPSEEITLAVTRERTIPYR
ncbi:MAG: hypothetical protein ACLTAF_02500 [Blautia coccoides]